MRGFGVRGVLRNETFSDLEEIKGSNIGHGDINVLKNGYIETRCPIFNTYFLSGSQRSPLLADFDSMNWMDPIVVCDYPVSFLRLVRDLYDVSNITCPVTVVQEYHNIQGLTLPAGEPQFLSLVHCLDGAHRYGNQVPIVSEATVYPKFNPDQTAYSLLKNVYTAFGLREADIPFFDKWGNCSRNNKNGEYNYD